MKKSKFTVLAILLSVVLLSSCNNGGVFCLAPKGDDVTQTIVLPEFDGVDLAIASNVTLHKGETQEVKITGSQNIIDNIERNVTDGVWKIKFDECVRKEGNLSFDITIPFLRSAEISGSGSIMSTDSFGGLDQLNVAIAGSGDINLLCSATHVETSIAGSGDIHLFSNSTSLKTSIAGSGNIYLRGTTIDENFAIAGSGSIHAFELLGTNGVVEIAGSGDCEINVSTILSITITGSGNVLYKGTPAIDLHVSGSGTATHHN